MDHHFNPPSIPLKPPLFVMGNITTATDPTEAWIEFILQHGAFNLLLGIPALAAWFAINYRSKQLEKLRPHSYGRTALIFWPSQIFIFLACLSLHQALYLNRNEHRYKTRSSNTLFLWYIISITLNLIAIYILHDQASVLPKLPVPTIIQYLALFTGFITLGFVVEAWPRSNTKVQALARETDNLSEYDLANLCSRLTYHYVDRIVSLGAKRPLVPADIDHTTPDYLRTNASYSRVSQAWEDEAAKAKASNGKYTPSFFWTVIRAYKARVLVSLFLRCVAFRLPFLTPILFKQLLAFITDYHRATNSGQEDVPALRGGLVIAFALFAINMVGTVLGTMALQWSYDFGMLARGASIAMNFLLLEEIDTTIVHRSDRQGPSEDSSPAIAVSIQKGTFTWEKPVEITSLTETNDENSPLLSRAASPIVSGLPTLRDIELTINDGSLTAIVGRIGQGKSSLLSALMGDMYKVDGVVKVFGGIAYVPQQAWIINATLKDNILFGQPFDQEKYDRIVFASGLVPDFVMLPAGDQTEIGERGINLSGGQKQRVSLARAAYQDADVYLLDDPLSAVDAHVDQHLWNHLIGPKGLLKTKTRLLVTHGVHHLEHVDQIVVFKDGSVSETGQYQELMEAGGSFYQLIKEYSVNVSTRQADQEEEFITDVDPGSGSSSSGASIILEGNEDKKIEKEGKGSSGAGELVAVEKMQNGRVSWSVVQTYSRAACYFNAVNCLLLFILGQAAHIGTNLWLRYWITDTDTSKENHEGRPVAFYLLGYAFFVLLFMVLDVSANYSAEVICGIRASRVLFQRLLVRVLQMPMSFFDTTPLGRIINRLSSDIDAIDTQLPNEMNDLLRFLAMIAGTFFVIAYSTPAFLIMIPPLGFVYFLIQDHYIRCSASMKRLYSVSKSPLYQHFSESLSGVSTIRVVRGLQDQFVAQNASRADTIVNRLNIYALSNRWLSTRIEFLGNVTILLASVLAVLNARTLDPTLSALALTYAINIVGQLTYLVRTVNEVQNLLVSVERVDEYSVKPIEAPRVTGVALPERWPEQGRVVFKNYSARYRVGLDLVIRNASFEVLPGEKVGIVGRTGAGKSSLALALFRIVEAANSYWALASDPLMEGKKVDFDDIQLGNAGGSIEIDGVDISTLGLRDLRQHLAIIPQDPTLFAGTVRENLDPFSEVSDADLWEALERAHLKSYISSLAGGLSYEVAQNGDNFSVGQRSLICLARALLRKTKVLILDEATAAVD
ncbi:Multidrug resistance-associated protein 1, partial [Haplosporangium bisporale]